MKQNMKKINENTKVTLTLAQIKKLVKESTDMKAWEFEGGEDHDYNPFILEILEDVAKGMKPKAYRYDDDRNGQTFIVVSTTFERLVRLMVSWGWDEESAKKTAKEIWELGVYDTFEVDDTAQFITFCGLWTRLV